jgi:hypothetical protein
MSISYPPIFINDYLQEKIYQSFESDFQFENDPNAGPATVPTIPFFPTSPTTIDVLTQSLPTSSYGLFAVYDRMFKMRRKAFPHIKDEQLLYYFYKTESTPELLIETVQKVQDLLDRGDESAQELNSWISSKLQNGLYIKQNKSFRPVFFHDIKIYQLEETRDIIDFGTARTYAGNKIIIDYCYHTMGHYTGKYIDAPNKYDLDRKAAELDPTKYNGTTI